MKVLHLLPNLHSGGVEQVVLELCESLPKHGYECRVISGGGRMVDDILATGATHITRPVGKKSPRALLEALWLKRHLLDEPVDVLHVHSRVPAWIAQIALKLMPAAKRPKLVSTFHGTYSINAYSKVMTRGDELIAVSDYTKEYMLEHFPDTPAEKIHVIHNSVNAEMYHPGYRPSEEWLAGWKSEYPEFQGRFLLSLPARITRLKGQLHLIPIVQYLLEKGIPVHAIIVGECSKSKQRYRREVEQKIAEAGLTEHITWLGLRRDLRDISCVTDVTLSLTLRPETFGKTTLEALSLGRPAMGYEHGGVGEQLRYFLPDGCSPTADPIAMAEKLAVWYQHLPTPVLELPEPFQRARMIDAHVQVYEKCFATV